MKKIVVCLLFLLLTALSPAQNARLYTPENGLRNTQINRIYQDSSGYIWICTEGGLVRFDGVGFVTYGHDRENPFSIVSDSVNDFYEDAQGRMWVGTSSGLELYDLSYNRFTHYDFHDSRSPSSDQFVSYLLEVPGRVSGSKLYVGTGGSGIYVIDLSTGELDDESREKLYRSVSSEYINYMFLDASRHLWIVSGNNAGFFVLDADTLEPATDWACSPDLEKEAGNIRITTICDVPVNQTLLVGTTSHGTLVFDLEKGVLRRAGSEQARRTGISTSLFNPRLGSPDERGILVSDENGGLLFYDAETETFILSPLTGVPKGFSTKKADVLFEDNQGNLWIGVYQSGIVVVPRSMFGFSYMGFGSPGFPDQNSACIMSVCEDDAGGLWVGTDGAGLFYRDADGKEVNYSRSNSGLTNNAVMTVSRDKRGTIWAGTYLDGLFCLDKDHGISRFPESGGVGTERIRILRYDPARDYMYVGTYGAGLVVIDAAQRKIIGRITGDDVLWVSALHLDAEGTLWIGSYNGPFRMDPDSWQLHPFKLFSHDERIRIYSIGSSPDGTVWFGTGEGLFASDNKGHEVRQFTVRDGLANNVVRDILIAPSGDLWVSTANGLSRLSPQSGDIVSFHAYDGLQGNEFRSGAALLSNSGKMYFGGTSGITYFSPNLVEGRIHRIPQVSLSRFTLLDNQVEYDPQKGDGNLIDKQISEATRITVPPETGLFSLEFCVPEYTNPQRIAYAYRLRGFDSEWKTVTGNLRMATYTKVPQGQYEFDVRAYFEGFPEDYSTCSVSLRVEAPWYRTRWAYALYLTLFVLLSFLLFRSFKRLQKQKEEQKKAELRELRLGLFTNLTHEIRTPLNLVMGPLSSMREAEQDPEKKDTYNLMYRNCLRINRLVNQVMDLRKVDAGQMSMHFRETDLVFFIRDIMQSFQNLADTKQVDFSFQSARKELMIWIDQGNFDKVIYNILSNAFKHTPKGGTVLVKVSSPQPNHSELSHDIMEYVEIGIFNSGSSIKEADKNRIFDRFVQVNPYDASVGSGVGLNLTKLLVGLHHGRISAENQEDGVLFRVLVPVGRAHLSDKELSSTTHHKDLYIKNAQGLPDSHEDETFARETNPEGRMVSSRKTVLVVEDDEETREYLRNMLQSQYNVISCPNADEAWPKITLSLPDAVVTDLVMPGMSGSELCARIRHNQATNHIPVIILTGQDSDEEQQTASDSGADKFLSKPISVELLRSQIAQVISARETVKGKFTQAMDFDYNDIKMYSADDKLVRRIVESIQAHLEDPAFDVAALCADVGISRVHLNRKLKEKGNVPPSVLIKSFRMKQAAYLLANNKVNVSEVAYRVGFSSHSYFSSSFRDFFGMTPREFVQQYAQNPADENLNKLFR
ncbi:MAG: response regulator [Bacteroidales bacterium]|nr:response regulator [Bacteroidales bacterium]